MKRIHLVPVFILSMLFGGGVAQAQLIGEIEADVPFPFHAGLAKFPAGHYIFHMEEGSDLSTMEIQSADGQHAALFEVRDAQTPRPPHTGELIFNHVGDRYFLAKIFDDGRTEAPSWTQAIPRSSGQAVRQGNKSTYPSFTLAPERASEFREMLLSVSMDKVRRRSKRDFRLRVGGSGVPRLRNILRTARPIPKVQSTRMRDDVSCPYA
jgi:hypothetical protein